MRFVYSLGLVTVAIASFLSLAGCGQTDAPPANLEASAEAPSADMAADNAAGDTPAAELAKLPEADRVLAEAQKLCPVSDHALGSMGVPPKVVVTVDGKSHDVFICCEGCRELVERDPAKYVAKLTPAESETK